MAPPSRGPPARAGATYSGRPTDGTRATRRSGSWSAKKRAGSGADNSRQGRTRRLPSLATDRYPLALRGTTAMLCQPARRHPPLAALALALAAAAPGEGVRRSRLAEVTLMALTAQ